MKKIIYIVFSVFCLSFTAITSAKGNTVKKSIEQGHIICYSRGDLIKLAEYSADQNTAGISKLLSSGECFMNKTDNLYTIHEYDPKEIIQAVILPSGKWARAFTFSLK